MKLFPFAVPRWLASAHLQTLGASLPFFAPPRSFRPAGDETLRIPLPRGGALHAHAWWHDGPGPRPAVVVVHGVGGSSESRYVIRAAVALHRAGWHVLRLDLRGAGDSMGDVRELYHAGLTEDPRATLDYLAEDPRVSSVGLVGFSLGGHVLLRLAGEMGAEVPPALKAVVAISAPLDLSEVTRAIERRRSYPYHSYILRKLVSQGKAFARLHPERAGYDVRALGKVRSIRAYDGLVVAPMHGFASAEDYYMRASAGPLVARIKVPTLLAHAEDDPMVPAESVRRSLAASNGAVEEAWTARGGHVGWFGGMDEHSWVNTWAVTQAIGFLGRHFGERSTG